MEYNQLPLLPRRHCAHCILLQRAPFSQDTVLTTTPGPVQWGRTGTQTQFSEVLTGLCSLFSLWTTRMSLWWQLSGATQQEVQLSVCVGDLVERVKENVSKKVALKVGIDRHEGFNLPEKGLLGRGDGTNKGIGALVQQNRWSTQHILENGATQLKST